MLSFWEKNSFLSYDYIIIGAGIVGLSSAISIKEKDPQASVMILEKGILPTGASTKNAGFACFGSFTELFDDYQTMRKNDMVQLVNQRWEGLQHLKKRLGNQALDYKNYGGYELITHHQEHLLHKLNEINELLEPIFKKPVFSEQKKLIKQFGFSEKQIKTIIYNPYEGQIDTGSMMKALAQLAIKNNITILNGANVLDVQESEHYGILNVQNPYQKDTISFKAKKIAVCTNGFTKKLFPTLEVEPGRGLVLVTKPLAKLKFKGAFHYDQGFYYFRDFYGRVIFGGGRNLAKKQENTTSFEINTKIYNKLIDELKNKILPDQEFEIDHLWTGIMAFGPQKKPILKFHSKRILLGVRLSGMGVAIGTSLGEEISKCLLS